MTTSKNAMFEFVALANDQTDGLVSLIEDFKSGKLTPSSRDFDLIVNHMKLLQRNLAKAIVAEQELMEEITKRLEALGY